MLGLPRLKITARLLLGFGVMMSMSIVLGLYANRSIGAVGDLTTVLYEHPFRVMTALLNARAEFRTIQRDTRDVMLSADRAELDALASGVDAGDVRMMDQLRIAREAFLGDKAMFDSLEAALRDFRAGYKTIIAQSRDGRRDEALAYARGPGKELAPAVIRAFAPILEFSNAKATAFMTNAQATREFTIRLNEILLAVALLVAAGAALATATSITRPLGRLRLCMDALARGEQSVDVPCLDRSDEVGAMAKTVDVFKHNAQEVERLRADQEEQKRRANEERRAELRRLADDFEGKVGSVVAGVTAATEQLQASSSQMATSAETTSSEATTVASAAEQASGNALTVANAAEELTSSITEIGTRVEHARTVAGRATIEASRSNELIRKLSETVTSIGTVVALINDIASQTNLLHLMFQI